MSIINVICVGRNPFGESDLSAQFARMLIYASYVSIQDLRNSILNNSKKNPTTSN